MPGVRTIEVEPITDADVSAVAEFLHLEMSAELSVADWHRSMTPRWHVEQPNHGFLLRDDGRVVGAYLALYSERVIDGRPRRICNLGTWCVTAEHRATGLRLLRSLLRQREYTFTDLSPNPNVVTLNARLGFTRLDTETALVMNTPWPVTARGVRVVDIPHEIDGLLRGSDRTIYRDHAASAAEHIVIATGDQSCHVMFRRKRYKRIPVASIIYVGNPDLFRTCAPHFYRYLLVRRGIPATLVEARMAEPRRAASLMVPGPPRMYLSEDLEPAQIDYLYSELVCLK
ncbi:hypothetical protein ACQI4L_11090 [Mycolicibacterium litorale]|uniref:hypothetical protein n=1 Tax=Mycolicibacterium litorale TaxID=758802 RepID=UPI003CF65A1A